MKKLNLTICVLVLLISVVALNLNMISVFADNEEQKIEVVKGDEVEKNKDENKISPKPRLRNLSDDFFNNDPFSTMKKMQDDMNRMFNDEFKNVGHSGFGNISTFSNSGIKIDMKEVGENLVITSDLPGMNKENLKIHIKNNRLTISGERNTQVEKKSENYYHQEIKRGLVQRTILLPYKVDDKKAKASYINGVLKIIVPKIGVIDDKGTDVKID